MHVDLDDAQAEVLEEFARGRGVSVSDCVYDAVDDWIRVGLKALVSTESMNVIGFPERMSR